MNDKPQGHHAVNAERGDARCDARSHAACHAPADVRSVSRLIAHTEDALLLAEHDGQIVGALIAAWDGWRGEPRLQQYTELRRRQGERGAFIATARG